MDCSSTTSETAEEPSKQEEFGSAAQRTPSQQQTVLEKAKERLRLAQGKKKALLLKKQQKQLQEKLEQKQQQLKQKQKVGLQQGPKEQEELPQEGLLKQQQKLLRQKLEQKQQQLKQKQKQRDGLWQDQQIRKEQEEEILPEQILKKQQKELQEKLEQKQQQLKQMQKQRDGLWQEQQIQKEQEEELPQDLLKKLQKELQEKLELKQQQLKQKQREKEEQDQQTQMGQEELPQEELLKQQQKQLQEMLEQKQEQLKQMQKEKEELQQEQQTEMEAEALLQEQQLADTDALKSRLEEAQLKKKKALKKKLHTMKLRHAAAAARQQQHQESWSLLPDLEALQDIDVLLISNISDSGPEHKVRFLEFFEPPDTSLWLEQEAEGEEMDTDSVAEGKAEESMWGGNGKDDDAAASPREEDDDAFARTVAGVCVEDKHSNFKMGQFEDAESDTEGENLPPPSPRSPSPEPQAEPQVEAPSTVSALTTAAACAGQFDDPDDEPLADAPTNSATEAVLASENDQEQELIAAPSSSIRATEGILANDDSDPKEELIAVPEGKDRAKKASASNTVGLKVDEPSAIDDGGGRNKEERPEDDEPKLFPPGEKIDHLKIIGILKRKMELRRKKIELKEKLQRLERVSKNNQVYSDQESMRLGALSRTTSEDDSEDTEDEEGTIRRGSLFKMTKVQLEERREKAQQNMDITQLKHMISKQSYLVAETKEKVDSGAKEIQGCEAVMIRERAALKKENERIQDLEQRSAALAQMMEEKFHQILAKRQELYLLQGGEKQTRRSSLLFEESLARAAEDDANQGEEERAQGAGSGVEADAEKEREELKMQGDAGDSQEEAGPDCSLLGGKGGYDKSLKEVGLACGLMQGHEGNEIHGSNDLSDRKEESLKMVTTVVFQTQDNEESLPACKDGKHNFEVGREVATVCEADLASIEDEGM